jgi:hypothetical protein
MTYFAQKLPELFYTYVSDTSPTADEEGETWYDPTTSNSYAWDGGTWVDLTVVDHSQLSGIGSSDHHSPVSTTDPLTVDAEQGVGMSLSSKLYVDPSGNLDISDSALNQFASETETFTASGGSASTKTVSLSNNYNHLIATAGAPNGTSDDSVVIAQVTGIDTATDQVTVDWENQTFSDATVSVFVFGVTK